MTVLARREEVSRRLSRILSEEPAALQIRENGSRLAKIYIVCRVYCCGSNLKGTLFWRSPEAWRRHAVEAPFAERPRMNLIEKLPEMSDEGVLNLLANAKRLALNGAPDQQAASAEALPAIEAEAAKRLDARKEATAERRARAVEQRKATTALKSKMAATS
jgi:hypothetical protein